MYRRAILNMHGRCGTSLGNYREPATSVLLDSEAGVAPSSVVLCTPVGPGDVDWGKPIIRVGRAETSLTALF